MATPADNLNTNQHAGSGPALTASGLGENGALTPNAPSTNLAAGGATYDELAVVKATFDKIIKWRARFEPSYRQFANVTMIDQAAFPGSTVSLFRTGAKGLGLAKTPLSEYADPDAVALPGLEDKMDVTVNEYGNSTVVTQRLQRFSWTEINPMQAEYIGRNMRDTVDAIYMESLYSLTGGFLKGGFRQAEAKANDVLNFTGAGAMEADKLFTAIGTDGGAAAADGGATSALTAGHVRRIVSHFRKLGVAPMSDGYYVGLITPDVAVALREATDVAGWRYPHLDGSWNGNILNGTVGIFEGVRFIEGPQFAGLDKGGTIDPNETSIVNVKPTVAKGSANLLFLGAEGIGDVVVEEPHAVITPTTDKFGRLAGLGWIGCFGTQVYDNNAGLLVQVK